jgi:hypothetical protein
LSTLSLFLFRFQGSGIGWRLEKARRLTAPQNYLWRKVGGDKDEDMRLMYRGVSHRLSIIKNKNTISILLKIYHV